MPTADIIINPIAGGPRVGPDTRVALARQALAALGVSGEVFVAERPGHAHEIAADLARRGRGLVIAWGGDGTVNEVGSALAHTATALGIVPAGSGDGLARELHLSRRPAEALRVAIEGRQVPFDVGELGGRLFLNIAGIGFDSEVSRRYNERPAGRRGLWPYVTLIFGALGSYEPDQYRVVLDGDPHDGRYLMVVFANSRQFGSRVRIAPEARTDDGLLNALLVDHRSIPGHMWRARHLLVDARRAPGVVRRPVRAATVEGTRALAVRSTASRSPRARASR